MDVRFEERRADEARLGVEPCLCGGCHPTATFYEGDPGYARHDPRLAAGPCCCGRFFVLGRTAEEARRRAEGLATERQREGLAPDGYAFAERRIALPWGEEVIAVSADFRPAI